MSATIKVLGSNSSGNGYLLQAGDDRLILECGIPCKEMLRIMNWDIHNAKILVTHRHSDHAKYIFQYAKYKFPIFSTLDVAESNNGVSVLDPMSNYAIGNFHIMPLKVPHGDCPSCYSYLIDHSSFGRMLFATDLETFPYKISGINHIFLECNWINDLVLDKMCSNDYVQSQPTNHMELNECISVIRRLYSPELRSVVLLHLSDKNSSENVIKSRFKSELGLDIEFANKGMDFILKDAEF